MRACPVCKAELQQQIRDGVTIDVCPDHGLWLDQRELLAVTEHARFEQGSFLWSDIFRKAIATPDHPGRTLTCPLCPRTLTEEVYAQVTMDWCPEHGVWLDNGELDAILNNLRLDPFYLRGLALRISDTRY